MRKRSSAIKGTYVNLLWNIVWASPPPISAGGEGLNFLPNIQKDGGEACYDLNFLRRVTGKVEVILFKTFFT